MKREHRDKDGARAPGGTGEVSEFSRIVAIEPDMGFGADATAFQVEADPEERAALARRFGLLSLDAFSAKGRIEVFERGRSARLEGHIVADAVQACVVTLEPVAAHVEDNFSLLYARDAGAGGRDSKGAEVEIAPGPEDEDAPEPLPESGIDVGEAAAECLGLALDPYPRAGDADEALAALSAGEEEEAPASPFAVLERLKRK
ncbi:MAG: DUF177 domain-containing protein [Alphaproteobacteria bacterium]|nr:DUF177 domain-containing protein [Alphaproteobacteria bacterium]